MRKYIFVNMAAAGYLGTYFFKWILVISLERMGCLFILVDFCMIKISANLFVYNYIHSHSFNFVSLHNIYIMSCIACPTGTTSSFNETQTKRVINNQVRVPSSLYTTNLAAVSYDSAASLSKKFISKHDSYARFLAKKKGILKGTAGIIGGCSC